jgi:hypothetical protein
LDDGQRTTLVTEATADISQPVISFTQWGDFFTLCPSMHVDETSSLHQYRYSKECGGACSVQAREPLSSTCLTQVRSCMSPDLRRLPTREPCSLLIATG